MYKWDLEKIGSFFSLSFVWFMELDQCTYALPILPLEYFFFLHKDLLPLYTQTCHLEMGVKLVYS